jgi:hypothetical protein
MLCKRCGRISKSIDPYDILVPHSSHSKNKHERRESWKKEFMEHL